VCACLNISEFTARTLSVIREKYAFPLAIGLGPFRKSCSMMSQPLSSGTKRSEGEADHSSPFGVEFKYTLSWGVWEQLYIYFNSVVVTKPVKNSLCFRTLKILHRVHNNLSLELNISNSLIYSPLFAKTNFNTNEYT
jgi:hypothetical protein